MILVDSSIWIVFFRGTNHSEGKHLQDLLDRQDVALAAPVRLEILIGATRRTLPQLRRLLSALPVFYPSRQTWSQMEDWVEEAVDAGQRFGMGDLLIASIAAEHHASIWSRDKDFERMARFGWMQLYVPKA